jgi:predicted esterase
MPLRKCFLAACALLLVPAALPAQEDVTDVPSQDLRAGNDEHKRYFLIGPLKGVKEPKDGYGLFVILPGGPGTAEFHPFVKRIAKHALPDRYLVAQPVAVKWTDKQEVVWPTTKLKAEKMGFTTEEFVAAVIEDVGKRHRLDPRSVFVLAWSSSGPAAYAISLSNPKVSGSFVAMSVFRPDWLIGLEKAKGHAYYLYQSPDDRVTPFAHAQRAAKELSKHGARVELREYEGGHGWRGPVFDEIRRGVEWLEKNRAANQGPEPRTK